MLAAPSRASPRFAFRLSARSSRVRSFSSKQKTKHEAPKDDVPPGWGNPMGWKVPAAGGFALIAALQWYHLSIAADDRREGPSLAVTRLPTPPTEFESGMATQRQLESIKLLPYRAISRLWGKVHDKELPTFLRAPVYKAWTYVYDCNLDEAKYPLESYRNLAEFFSRPLKDDVRPIEMNPRVLTSPVDGVITSFGIVDETTPTATLEQIKGARYRLDDFIGDFPSWRSKDPNKVLYQCVIYLAPGDYHRIHSPIDWKVMERRHFPGNLFPVNSRAAKLIPSLFVENERVVLMGKWQHGMFSMSAVGATNVGSITLSAEPDFLTNVKEQDQAAEDKKCFIKEYGSGMDTGKGDEVAQFRLGSTVVLVFEAPKNFQFTTQPGEKLMLGKPIGQLRD